MALNVTAQVTLPPGPYIGELAKVARFKKGDQQYGPAAELSWNILEGEFAGATATTVCSLKLSAGSRLGALVTSMRGGKPFEPGEDIDLEKYVGQTHHLTLAPIASKPEMTRVESILLKE